MSKKKRKKTAGKPYGGAGKARSGRRAAGKSRAMWKSAAGSSRIDRKKWALIVAAVVAGILILAVAGVLLHQRSEARKQALEEQRQAELEAAQRDAEREARLGLREIVRIQTSKGEIVMEVFPELMPDTVRNFLSLAASGFYDGLTWHRVEAWVVQTGDPTGTGSGGSGRTIRLETHEDLPNVRGAVGMARTNDPHSATSQFYLLKADARSLDGQYAVFGRVVQGMDVVDKLAIGDKMTRVTVEPSGESGEGD